MSMPQCGRGKKVVSDNAQHQNKKKKKTTWELERRASKNETNEEGVVNIKIKKRTTRHGEAEEETTERRY